MLFSASDVEFTGLLDGVSCAYDYPDGEAHLQAHEAFRAKADALARSVDAGEQIDLKAVLVFLTD